MTKIDLSSFERANEAISYLRTKLPETLQKPQVAIVCGSGLGGLADTIQPETRIEFDYASIPHFPRSTVVGHAGKLVFGLLGQKIPAVLMVGRAHYYEGHSIDQVTFPIRVFKQLQVNTVVLTNAAGGLNSLYDVGDIVLLNDVGNIPIKAIEPIYSSNTDLQHLFLAGLAGTHPLRGANEDEFGVRFPPLSDAYDLELRRHVHQSWKKVTSPESKRQLHEGVYAFCGGPTYETRAESRMLRMLGADVVGMSTVPEIVTARHCGLRVLAFSLVTNKAVLSPVPRGDDDLLQNKAAGELSALLEEGMAGHEEVLEAGRAAAIDMQKLVVETLMDVFGSV
ncbi:Purine nucleoside phosphorylase I, inosine and guanosine-specific [Penicillium digitatum PHI26]|uniref:purine-nucleoside phosphorylase n=2 Tax=Penicillium digitatum TaxID=36651 RepID=K9FQW2_PEND2|nr:Purine nucleoside phosphorylase I, inosine and guanosine-specific [Penicillium digitatum Pd1]EKV12080.1 Purine nucleoside phosphorylase I, inosine and guanosine-specific [Penicillium digitatum PHI26]EKV20226.1 Purine nucleoside phosphorylase I, inosine and guanosine-specific [Penicillium digitatum Pd1]